MLEKFKETINSLRDPETGCPWDLKQTHLSLIKYLLEECYEFIDTVENNDFNNMRDELGDILLQILLHSKLAEEKNHFNVNDVIRSIDQKMKRRHPHVFGNLKDQTINIETIKKNWKMIKKEEETKLTGSTDDYFYKKKDSFNASLTAALNIGIKSKEVNFDWENFNQVTYKVEEEWQEVKEELISPRINKKRVDEEIGDLLFSVAQLARHLDIDPEKSLKKANLKFIKRFREVEDQCRLNNEKLSQVNQDKLEQYWNIVKRNEIQNKK